MKYLDRGGDCGRGDCGRGKRAPTVVVAVVVLLMQNGAIAQIIPDPTWGAENSTVNPGIVNQQNVDLISNGAQRGGNLFHSFQQFNIAPNQQVYFNNPTNVQNIFTRVTGGIASNIQGLLGVNGTANLFLLNPSGILFGPNAQLDLRGSFTVTTAKSIQFDRQGEFPATSPNAPPLLTVQPSALLFGSSGQIVVQSVAYAGMDDRLEAQAGLRVGDGKSLLLIGGDVVIDRGALVAIDGQVQLGGLSQGMVGLNISDNRIAAQFPSSGLNKVTLSNNAIVNVRSGEVLINADRLEISKSRIYAFNPEDGTPTVSLPRINFNANTINISNGIVATRNGGINLTAQTITLSNDGQIDVETYNRLPSGDIQITAIDRLSLETGSTIETRTGSNTPSGFGGRVTINSRQIDISGSGQQSATPEGEAPLYQVSGIGTSAGIRISATEVVGAARGGDLVINTERLNVFDGGLISTGVFFGTYGNSGDLTINAREGVTVTGTGERSDRLNGGISIIRAETFGYGDAGNLTINTPRLVVQDTGLVSTRAFYDSAGQGGNLTINAVDEVSLLGKAVGGLYGSKILSETAGTGNAGVLSINTKQLNVRDGGQIATRSDYFATGNGNALIVNADRINLSNGGELNASSEGSGAAGSIFLHSGFTKLDGAYIRAFSRGQNGGNIQVSDSTVLLLRNNSQITTQAGVNQLGGGSGGDIRINSNFLVGLPAENSFLSANAYGGRGGRVQITANSILGIQQFTRSQLETFFNTQDLSDLDLTKLPSSITTVSQLSPDLSGDLNVQIFTPDPAQGATELTTEVVDPASQIAQTCPRNSGNVELGNFVVSGRGSLPPDPFRSGGMGDRVIAPLAVMPLVMPGAVMPKSSPVMGLRGLEKPGRSLPSYFAFAGCP
jgi:filamentous hemagglutinin family protein